MRDSSKKAAGRAVFALCLLIFAIQAFTSLRQESATWDETHYFGLGKYLLTTREWNVPGSILHPPLSYYWHSVPLLFVETDARPWNSDPARDTDPVYLASADIERGQWLLASPANAGDRLLTATRSMMVLAAMLLCCFVYSWCDRLYGKSSAVLATILFCFCPNILAHARLITPDILLTTFSFIAVYYLWRLLKESRTRHALLGGIALGLALLSKFTGLLLLPICIGLIALSWLERRAIPWRACLIFVGAGLAVLALGYGMSLDPYFAGLAFQERHAQEGHASFLLGRYSDAGFWYYIAVAFLIKTPVGLLILLFLAAAGLFRSVRAGEWLDGACLVLPVLAIAGFFSVNHQSIGLRYILPVYPFLFVLAGAAAKRWATAATGRAMIMGLAAWYVGASLWIHPHYLAYFNELSGGPSNGYKCLVDSNLDWGQGLKGLKRYMDAQGISRVSLSYFGSDAPDRYGIAYDWLPSNFLKDPAPGRQRIVLGSGTWVAISATNLQGVYFKDRDMFATFRDRRPDAVIGYSIFLYRLKAPGG